MSGEYSWLKNLTALGGGFLLLFAIFFLLPPVGSSYPKLVGIERGSTVEEAGLILKKEGVLRSLRLFKILVRVWGGGVRAGAYSFEAPPDPIYLTYRLITGETKEKPIIFKVLEGEGVKEIAKRCEELLPNCKEADFLKKAANKEGYLFPDTYYVYSDTGADDLLALMEKNFEEKISILKLGVLSDEELKKIITIASILEREAQSSADRALVSGILWKRLRLGMALQVDATLFYETGKKSLELASEDLAKDSLYNSYTRRGLPPTPIGNPGLDAIRAALNPTLSPYLFYLTGKDGKFYFAETHEEHVQNKELYLR